MKTLIIEDEKAAVNNLKALIAEVAPPVRSGRHNRLHHRKHSLVARKPHARTYLYGYSFGRRLRFRDI